MMQNRFEGFIRFGSVADADQRDRLAQTLYDKLRTGTDDCRFANADTGNFGDALERILGTAEIMREVCAKDPALAERVAQDILDFIDRTVHQYSKTENPFAREEALFSLFEQAGQTGFADVWEKTSAFLRETYSAQELDVNFYTEQFQGSAAPGESEAERFAAKWGGLLKQKQTSRELAFIEEKRNYFSAELCRRIAELKKMQELFAPFISKLERLWDMGRDCWQSINFDALERYVELLEWDTPLRELVAMMDRVLQAEREFEEEFFKDIAPGTDRKFAHAGKAELVGIHESDCLNSMLPAEAALLGDETTETLFYKKFCEKNLQTFQYQAKNFAYREQEPGGRPQKEAGKRGPFIVCVDTSGSMRGMLEPVAKTLCFALLNAAVRDNRKCYFVSFSTGICRGIETLNITDFKNNLDNLAAFLAMTFHEGIDASPTMQESLRILETETPNKADVIVVSDSGTPSFDEQTREQIKAAQNNETKFHSLVIDGTKPQTPVEPFAHNWTYGTSDPQNALNLVKNIHEI
jgi:uncharacterized protein with von Willebrand factor type A (vWA) domain